MNKLRDEEIEKQTYKAHLLVRRIETREIVHRVGVSNLSPNYIDRVVRGMLINMNRDKFFVDESEVDAAREVEAITQ